MDTSTPNISTKLNGTGKKAKELVYSGVNDWNHVWTKIYKKKTLRRSENDHGGFQQQSPQRLVDEYKHTSSRNDRWWIWLKLIQEEYYSIGNQKS